MKNCNNINNIKLLEALKNSFYNYGVYHYQKKINDKANKQYNYYINMFVFKNIVLKEYTRLINMELYTVLDCRIDYNAVINTINNNKGLFNGFRVVKNDNKETNILNTVLIVSIKYELYNNKQYIIGL